MTDKLDVIYDVEEDVIALMLATNALEAKLALCPKEVVYLYRDKLDDIFNRIQRQLIRCDTHEYQMDNNRISKMRQAGEF